MQEWSSREISTAVLQDTSVDHSVDKLRFLLVEVKKAFPEAISDQVIRTLCQIEKLSIYNPLGAESVWIATGSLKQVADFNISHVEANGYSPTESIVELIKKIAITHALSTLSQNNEALGEGSAHPALFEYSQKLLGKLLLPVTSSNELLPVRHLANRVDSVFPKALYLQAVSGELPVVTEGCGAAIRQRDAIAAALCEKIEMHAFALWRYRQLPPRKSSPEIETIFEYYNKRCLRRSKLNKELLLDISLDWGPQVYVAVSFHGDDGYLVAGTGCGISAYGGIAKAVLALRHNESYLHMALQKHQTQGPASLNSSEQEIVQEIKGNDRLNWQLTKVGRDPIKEVFWPERTFVRRVARQAESAGFDMFYTDIAPIDSPLSVVKIISPQLLTTASAG